jgi:hypothetical protein
MNCDGNYLCLKNCQSPIRIRRSSLVFMIFITVGNHERTILGGDGPHGFLLFHFCFLYVSSAICPLAVVHNSDISVIIMNVPGPVDRCDMTSATSASHVVKCKGLDVVNSWETALVPNGWPPRAICWRKPRHCQSQITHTWSVPYGQPSLHRPMGQSGVATCTQFLASAPVSPMRATNQTEHFWVRVF